MGSFRTSASSALGFAFLAAAAVAGTTSAQTRPALSATSDTQALQEADGSLEHMFSASFAADPTALSRIEGLESRTFARTSDGGAIRLRLDAGEQVPPKVTSVELLEVAGAIPDEVVDPLDKPAISPTRVGHRLVTTFRIPGTKVYLTAWRNSRTDEYSLTIWDELHPTGKQPIVAVSSAPILAAAAQLSVHGNPLSITVWTRGHTPGQAVVGIYNWWSGR